MATTMQTTMSGQETAPNTDNDARRKQDKRILAHFMFIITCLTYLAVALQMFNSGLSSTAYFMEPNVVEAKTMLHTYTHDIHRQNILTKRLATLQTKRLGKVFFESHEECLARGIKTANRYLLIIGFRYPEIRRQAIEWTEETCAQLHFVPQAMSRPTRQQIVLEYWTEIGHRCREYSAHAVMAMEQIVKYAWNGMTNMYRGQDRSTAFKHIHIVVNDLVKLQRDLFIRMKLPAGIDIKCDKNSTICHLTYERILDIPSEVATTSADSIAESAKRVSTLLKIMDILSKLGNVIATLESFILCTASFILGSYASLIYQSRDQTKPILKDGWSIRGIRISKELHYVLCLQVVGFLVHVIEVLIQPESEIRSYLSLIFGFIFLATGLKMLADFLNPLDPHPNAYRLVNEVYRLMLDSDAPVSTHEESDEDTSEDTPVAPVNSPLSTPPTEITDVDTESETDSDIYTEYGTDSDDDSDDDDFVDLAA